MRIKRRRSKRRECSRLNYSFASPLDKIEGILLNSQDSQVAIRRKMALKIHAAPLTYSIRDFEDQTMRRVTEHLILNTQRSR